MKLLACKASVLGSTPSSVSMTLLDLAPVRSGRERSTVLSTPNGVVYMMGTPSVMMAFDMIETDVTRVVFSARQPRSDWDEARRLLVRAGIRIEGSWQTV